MTLFDDQTDPPAAPTGPSVRVRLQVAYDGRRFHGFAVQGSGVRTVGGVLAGALERILRLPAPPALTCAGRTDAGVHARDQWVHLDVPETTVTDPADLTRRLLKLLGPEVVVRSLAVAPEGWDARRSALRRTYEYSVLTTPSPDPFRAGFVWWLPGPLDLRAMQLACDAIVGEHDFSSFCRRQDGRHLVRTVRAATWTDVSEGVMRFDITADAFCQQMVRSLVGTLADVGKGKTRAGEMLTIIRARDRAAAGTVAPPDGLVLAKVDYPTE
ncbi:MAG: tRNA pseudouridine(38-40) synthase TruA [Acidimicrobiales bacterium]